MLARILDGSFSVGVIGLGYVGLPMAVGFARVGRPVVGVDTDSERIETLRRGRSPIQTVAEGELRGVLTNGLLTLSADYSLLSAQDALFICVPTPLTPWLTPDLSFIISASESLVPHLRREQVIILQSTTYPGTTEEQVQPILERSGLAIGEDLFLAFSPERINPGDSRYGVGNTPKVVGGATRRCGELAQRVLSALGAEVHLVSSPRAAEMTKLLENIFRAVNIAMVNEFALLCERMGLDVWEVIAAASSKPFGFMPFYPGPGVGGHCIPVDPYYLLWKAKEFGFQTKFIELAAEANQAMPGHAVSLVSEALNRQGKCLRGARILLLGVAFKKDVEDARNSPAERIAARLLDLGANLEYHDPYVPTFQVSRDRAGSKRLCLLSTPLNEASLASADCVVVVTGHTSVDYARVVASAALVVDTCNATQGLASPAGRVVRLGAPTPA